MPSARFFPVWMASFCPVGTRSCLPPVGNIHQLGDPPQLAPAGPVCRPQGMTPKFYHTSPPGGTKGSWRRHREIPCTAVFGGEVGLFNCRYYLLFESGVKFLVYVVDPLLFLVFIAFVSARAAYKSPGPCCAHGLAPLFLSGQWPQH